MPHRRQTTDEINTSYSRNSWAGPCCYQFLGCRQVAKMQDLDFLPYQPRDLRVASFNKPMRTFLRSTSILHPAAQPNTRTGLYLHQRELTFLTALLRGRQKCVCVHSASSRLPFYMLTTGFEKWPGITTVVQVSND